MTVSDWRGGFVHPLGYCGDSVGTVGVVVFGFIGLARSMATWFCDTRVMHRLSMCYCLGFGMLCTGYTQAVHSKWLVLLGFGVGAWGAVDNFGDDVGGSRKRVRMRTCGVGGLG